MFKAAKWGSDLARMAVLSTALVLTGAVAAREPIAAVEVAKGWRMHVLAKNIAGVDTLVFGSDGELYATRELGQGFGEVVRIRKGVAESVAGKLNRPDGLIAHGKFLYVTEEVAEGGVVELDIKNGTRRIIGTLRNPEGIGWLRGALVVAEDAMNGRIVRMHLDGRIDILIGGLNRPEGLCVAKNGTIYFAETATGRVLAYRRGEVNTVVEDLDEPDQVNLAPDGALWVTEDANPGRLLRLKNGKIEVVLSGLVFAQGIAFRANGQVLMAEQGRGRILLITGTDNTNADVLGGPDADEHPALPVN